MKDAQYNGNCSTAPLTWSTADYIQPVFHRAVPVLSAYPGKHVTHEVGI